MGYQRTFVGLVPPEALVEPNLWQTVLVEEGPTLHGPWAQIAAENMEGEDVVTVTAVGSEDPAYYRTLWEDTESNLGDGPVFYLGGPQEEWAPSVAQVAALVWARTKVAGGTQVGTFTDKTRPDLVTATSIIEQAVGLVAGSLGSSPCTGNLRESSRSHAALMASMLIESSFYPEQVESTGSSFQARLRLWERSIDKLAGQIRVNCGSGEEGEEGLEGGGVPAGGFDDGLLLYGRDYPCEGGW